MKKILNGPGARNLRFHGSVLLSWSSKNLDISMENVINDKADKIEEQHVISEKQTSTIEKQPDLLEQLVILEQVLQEQPVFVEVQPVIVEKRSVPVDLYNDIIEKINKLSSMG